MSFGFGIGDFLTVIALATRIRKEFVGAPQECRAISDELKSLSVLLLDIEVDMTNSDMGTDQAERLKILVEGSQAVLRDLEAFSDKYIAMESNTNSRVDRAWKRFKFDTQEVDKLRARLISNVSMLRAFSERHIKEGLVQMVRHFDNQKRQQILDWVSKENHTAKQNHLLRHRLAGSRRWLLESLEWKEWVKSRGSTLYCPGIPGSGKTYTTAIVIEELQNMSQVNDGMAVAFVFCDYQRQEENVYELLARSLLRTLLEQLDMVPQSLNHLYDTCMRSGHDLNANEVYAHLKIVTSQIPWTTLVVDALDELEPESRDLLVTNLYKLQSEAKVNLFFTSRKVSTIQILFPRAGTVEVTATSDDVQNYLADHMKLLPGFVQRNKAIQDEIKDAIIIAADGMFLLAELYLEPLKDKKSPKAIRASLRSLFDRSASYEKAYRDAMVRIQAKGKDRFILAKTTFLILTQARRPLRAMELCHALGVEANEFDPEDVPDIEDVLSNCTGLVTYHVESDVVQLVHRSTKEYFEACRAEWFPDAAVVMRDICVAYKHARDAAADGKATEADFPFLDYVNKYTGSHQAQVVNENAEKALAN
ncbi:hypothetical protein BP5796_05776 [Coleophoma crateriformis]|uniref:Nephrocystin 3-like N-terminal domain-containing protein n=1 Tax=Coleophoma crateriformis TaxID=565419 RepID=A0A3D8RVM9_9HELO|nr:hypothetical protein BP5796_05776 [Coleophoma crateriformis]